MWLQSESTPDPHDGILRQTCLLRHQSSAPVRAVGWHRFQGLRDDVFNLLIGDLARRADPRLIQQSIESELSKPLPPLTDCGAGDVQLARDLGIAHPLLTTQHDPGSQGHSLSRLWPASDHAQLFPICSGNFQRLLGATCAHTQVCAASLTYSRYFSLRTLAGC